MSTGSPTAVAAQCCEQAQDSAKETPCTVVCTTYVQAVPPGCTTLHRTPRASRLVASVLPANSPEPRREGAPTPQLVHGHRSVGKWTVASLDNILQQESACTYMSVGFVSIHCCCCDAASIQTRYGSACMSNNVPSTISHFRQSRN